MVDDDKKKDLDSEYSALNDALEGGDPAPSLEDLLKDHGIDLDSDMDLDAMQDFSFSEQSEKPSKPARQDDDIFADNIFDDNLFEENLFDEPAPPPKRAARQPEQVSEPVERYDESDDNAIFEASDFDDVDTGGGKDDLGGDPLFDYDPQGEATFADMGGAEPDVGSDGSIGGDVPPANQTPGAKRIFARLGAMLVMVTVIYGGLKLFLGESTPETVAQAPADKTPPSKIASIATTTVDAPAKAETTVAPTVTAVPEPVMPTPAPEVAVAVPAPLEATAPSSLPVPGSLASGLPQANPIVTEGAAAPLETPVVTTQMDTNKADTALAVETPQTSLDVNVPLASMTGIKDPATASVSAPSKISLGSGDVNDKLDNLELALQSIDQRLAQASSGGVGEEKIARLERLVSDSSAPEMQNVLNEALKKMKELDRKMERISELQHQVRLLNTDVKMLKEDVVTQTNIVGEQQRLFNDNVQLSQMQEPGPVKMIVQAAIPGRAWLRSERGELLTVIPGDEVPGYGRVVSIDAASGTVVTSSRAVFREQ